MTASMSKVLRNGELVSVKSEMLVKGDVIILEAGDSVPADARVLQSASMKVEEAALTGESVPVEKHAEALNSNGEKDVPLGDRKNMVYMGSTVVFGRGVCVVTATGMDTEMGRIAGALSQAKDEQTPLQKKLNQLSKILSFLVLGICAVIFAVDIFRIYPDINAPALIDTFMVAVSLAVAAIPEGLAAVVTIVLSIGVTNMSKRNAVIRKLTAVETLGCTQVICSDKTGTLTQNKMTVQQIYIDGKTIEKEELDLKNQLHRYLLYDCILTNDSSIVDGKGIGDPTEYALLEMAREISVNDETIRRLMPRMEEIPFDSDRKLMSTKYQIHGIPTILTKGALDVMLGRTSRIRTAKGVCPITEEDKKRIADKNREFSENGLRVLAFGYKEVPMDDVLEPDDEQDLIFLGLVSMMDPPREESRIAVEDAKRAGIRTVMITGDHKITAQAIAKQIGIYGEGDMAVTGSWMPCRMKS